jgi:phage tail-like protein
MNRTELVGLFPAVFQRALAEADAPTLARMDAGRPPGPAEEDLLTPFAAQVDVMIALLAPAEAALDRFPEALAPERAPAAFLPLLARWLHLDRAMAPDEVALRALLSHAALLWRNRGTRAGLEDALACVLGRGNFLVEQAQPSRGSPRGRAVRFETFHVRVHVVPEGAGWRMALERLVETMKPIHVSHELLFDHARKE